MAAERSHHLVRIRPRRLPVRAAVLGELSSLLDERRRMMECAHDPRAGFAGMLSVAVGRIDAALRSEAFGAADEWVERVTVEHANQYLRAADAWDRGDMSLTAAPWRAVFALARQSPDEGDVSRLSLLVHMSYDLPLALARPAFPDGDRMEAKEAYTRITALLSINGGGVVARLMRRDDRMMRSRRERAWDDAMALVDARDGEELRARFSDIERRALREVVG